MQCERTTLEQALDASLATIEGLKAQVEGIGAIADCVVAVLQGGGKVLTAGNGGSAAEALHMSEELVGRFRDHRRSLPGICLAGDPTALTCIGNDYGYDRIFARQVEGLGTAGDVLVCFSTSGNAANLRLAMEAAHERGVKTVALLGRDGGAMAGLADLELVVRGTQTERIQEAHQVILHLVLDAVERAFGGDTP